MENIIFNELKIRGFNVDVGVITLNKTNEKGHGIRIYDKERICTEGLILKPVQKAALSLIQNDLSFL